MYPNSNSNVGVELLEHLFETKLNCRYQKETTRTACNFQDGLTQWYYSLKLKCNINSPNSSAIVILRQSLLMSFHSVILWTARLMISLLPTDQPGILKYTFFL